MITVVYRTLWWSELKNFLQRHNKYNVKSLCEFLHILNSDIRLLLVETGVRLARSVFTDKNKEVHVVVS